MYIGIDVGGTKISAGLVKNGKVLRKIILEEKINSGNQFLELLFSLIDKLYGKNIKGIGIGVPAIVQDGLVLEPLNLNCIDSIKLAQIISKKYKIKARIANDAKCFALGELLFGSAKKFNNLACITIGTGLGGAIIINKKIYLGKNHGAGEFGAIKLEKRFLEDTCSGKFFIKKGKSGKEFYKLAKKGDRNAINIFNEYGKNIGKTLALIACSINPDKIIIGGSVSESFNFFEKEMLASLKESTYNSSFKGLKIIKSKNADFGLIGAAHLCDKKTEEMFFK